MPVTLRTVVLIGTMISEAACHPATPAAEAPHDAAPSVAAPTSPPADTAPAAIVSQEVSIPVGDRAVPATITRPAHGTQLPAVLFHAGSGPTDRDWNNPLIPGTNGSGKLLAEALARRGIVSLRFDKLGTGKNQTLPPVLTWESFLGDAAAALARLRSDPHVDPAHVFIAGHSEGGLHAIELARGHHGDLAGLLLLSTPGRTMRDVILAQLTAQFRAAGVTGDALEKQLRPIRQAFADFFAGKTVDPKKVSAIRGVQNLLVALFNPTGAALARKLLAFDPAAALASVGVPVFIYNGAKDVQVSPTDDAQALARAARVAHLDTTLFIAPDANHVLEHEPRPLSEITPLTVNYNAPDRSLDPATVNAIGSWILKHSR